MDINKGNEIEDNVNDESHIETTLGIFIDLDIDYVIFFVSKLQTNDFDFLFYDFMIIPLIQSNNEEVVEIAKKIWSEKLSLFYEFFFDYLNELYKDFKEYFISISKRFNIQLNKQDFQKYYIINKNMNE